jgi:hypothetical protein
LRAARAPNHASGARHVALHVLHARRRLDRNAAGVEADALADEGYGIDAALAAVPAHDDEARFMNRALADAEKRAHAELLHGRNVEHFDIDAELRQAGHTAGEFAGIEHVRRFVDEIAREHDTFGDA